jgi:hypothetical protein
VEFREGWGEGDGLEAGGAEELLEAEDVFAGDSDEGNVWGSVGSGPIGSGNDQLLGAVGKTGFDFELEESLDVFRGEVWERGGKGEDPIGGEGDGATAFADAGVVEGFAEFPAEDEDIVGEEIAAEVDGGGLGGLGGAIGATDVDDLPAGAIGSEAEGGWFPCFLEAIHHLEVLLITCCCSKS